MVWKRSKHGLNTGNSLISSGANTYVQKGFLYDVIIKRQSWNTNGPPLHSDELLEATEEYDGGMQLDMQYSLNKQARWLFPFRISSLISVQEWLDGFVDDSPWRYDSSGERIIISLIEKDIITGVESLIEESYRYDKNYKNKDEETWKELQEKPSTRAHPSQRAYGLQRTLNLRQPLPYDPHDHQMEWLKLKHTKRKDVGSTLKQFAQDRDEDDEDDVSEESDYDDYDTEKPTYENWKQWRFINKKPKSRDVFSIHYTMVPRVPQGSYPLYRKGRMLQDYRPTVEKLTTVKANKRKDHRNWIADMMDGWDRTGVNRRLHYGDKRLVPRRRKRKFFLTEVAQEPPKKDMDVAETEAGTEVLNKGQTVGETPEEKPKQSKTDITLWEFINVVVNHDDTDKKVKITHCGKKSCSDKVIKKENLMVPKPPPCNTVSLRSVRRANAARVPGPEKQFFTIVEPGGESDREKGKIDTPVKKVKSSNGQRARQRAKRRALREKSREELQINLDQDNDRFSAKSHADHFKHKGVSEDLGSVWIQPVLLKMKSGSIKARQLGNRYSNKYSEAQSLPRKFSINISDIFRSSYESCADWKDNSLSRGLMAYVMLEVTSMKEAMQIQNVGMQSQGLNAEWYELVSIHVKSDLDHAGEEKVHEYLRDKTKSYLIYPISKIIDLIGAAFNATLTTSPSCIKHLPRIPAEGDPGSSYSGTRLEWLQTMCQWQVKVYGRQEAADELDKLPLPTPQEDQPSVIDTERQRTSPYQCYNCATSVLPREWSVSQGNALAHCNHWFCNDCWRCHLVKTLKDEVSRVTCPDPHCETPVDDVTFLHFLSLTQFKEYQDQVRNMKVRLSPDWQHCPNSACSRTVHVAHNGSLDQAVCVECQCGHIWCFACQQQAHWPAPCAHAAIYWTKLALNGDGQRLSVVQYCVRAVWEQALPPISKSGVPGSLDLSGVNIFEFCWHCLAFKDEIDKYKHSKNMVMLDMNSAQEQLLPLLHYRNAVSHRSFQKTWNTVSAESHAALVARMIKRSRAGASLSLAKGTSGYACLPPISRAGTQIAIQDGSPRPNPVGHVTPGHHGNAGYEASEMLFLVIVQQFLYQAHFVLEHVSIMLLSMVERSVKDTVMLTRLLVRLEGIVSYTDKVLNQLAFSPASIIPRLKQLLKAGQDIMVAIATEVKTLT